MTKLFLSFLGTTNYLPVNYTIENYKKENIQFVQEASIEYNCKNWNKNDRIVLFLTNDAKKCNWVDNGHRNKKTNKIIINEGLETRLKKLNLPIKEIKIAIIPIGAKEEQLYEIFEIILSEINPKDQIYVDITHAFRSLPFILLISLMYARVVKNIDLKGLFYGAFETLGKLNEAKKIPIEKRNVPIFDLTPFYVLLDWMIAVNIFNVTGRTDALVQTTKENLNPLIIKGTKHEKAHFGEIISLMRYILTITSNFQTCRGKQLMDFRPYELIQKIEKNADNFIPIMKPLVKVLQSNFTNFTKSIVSQGSKSIAHNTSVPQWILNQIGTLNWCLTHKLIQQTCTFLREFMITYIFKSIFFHFKSLLDQKKDLQNEKLKQFQIEHTLKILEKKSQFFREKVISGIAQTKFNLDNEYHNPTLNSPLSLEDRVFNLDYFIDWIENQIDKPFCKLFSKISSLRNDINHAGFRISSLKAKNILVKVQEYKKKWINYLAKNHYQNKKISTSIVFEKLWLKKKNYQRLKMLLIFSHNLLPEQKLEASKRFKIQVFEPLPPKLKNIWMNIDPTCENIQFILSPIKKWILDIANKNDLILIQGDFGATVSLVQFCWKKYFIPIYATTQRIKTEILQTDGSIEMKQHFKHIRFRKYQKP